MYEPDDRQALVDTVKMALADSPERAAMRVRARADMERHSWQGSTNQLRQYYAQAIEHPRPKAETIGPKKRPGLRRRMVIGTLRKLLP